MNGNGGKMKKKIIITLAIFFGIAILVVFCLFQYLNKNQLLENTTYTPQDRVNHNFDLNLDSNIPTTVIFDTTNNFRTDGELYFIVDYSTYSDDKIEQELALTTFSKKTDSSQSRLYVLHLPKYSLLNYLSVR